MRLKGKVVPARAVSAAALLALAPLGAGAQLMEVPFSARELADETARVLRDQEWQRHRDFLEKGLLAAGRALRRPRDGRFYDPLLSDAVAAPALARSAFIRAVGAAVLKTVACDHADFARWLVGNREALEAYVMTVKPEDDAGKALGLWARLWAADSGGRDKYAKLALACAVVFDVPLRMHPGVRPGGNVDMLERYNYFRECAEKNRLKTTLEELPPWEIVWVVDAPAPNSELVWAREHVRLARGSWSRAYDMVAYRMEKAMGGKALYEEYTLREILRRGGICSDRAYFAAMTAKASGIPAMPIIGEGQRGGHAWFGYKAGPKSWNMNAGRFASDRYVTGYATDPQTRRRIKEQELAILADPQLLSAAYPRAWQLLWLADVFAAQGDQSAAGEAHAWAVAVCPRHLKAWMDYVAHLERTNAGAEVWKDALQRMRAAFRDYPDVTAKVADLERQKAPARDDAAAADSLRREARDLARGADGRTDLAVEKVVQQAELLSRQGDLAGAGEVYYRSLRELGSEAAVFRKLAGLYFALAARDETQDRALKNIHSVFRRHFPAPGRDYFAMTAHAGMLEFLAGLYGRAGETRDAEHLKEDAERLRKTAQSVGKFR